MSGRLVLQCSRCLTRYTLVDVRDWMDVNDADQLLDVALDFSCPVCGNDFVVERASTTEHGSPVGFRAVQGRIPGENDRGEPR